MKRDIELEKRTDRYVKGNMTEEEALELWEDLLENSTYIKLLETELVVKRIFETGSPSASKDQIVKEVNRTYTLQNSWK